MIEEGQNVAATKKAGGSERGAGMAEYAFLLVLIALALIIAFQGLASGINDALSATVAAFP